MTARPQSQNDPGIAAFLSDYVDGVAPLATLLEQYHLSRDAISDLVHLTDRLRQALLPVAPSEDFVQALYHELGQHRQRATRNWWARVPVAVPVRMPALPNLHHMSHRTRLAAGLGGLTLVYLTARSLSYLRNLRQRGDTSGEMAA